MPESVTVIQGALSRLLEWLKNSPWESYDPYDYKGKPQVAWVLKKPLPARFLNYAGLCFPGLTRRLLKVSPTGTASGYAYLLSGFSRLASIHDNDAHRKLAQKALALLLESRIPEGGWGLPFDWQTSHAARIPKDTTLSYTTYTGLQALLDYGHYTGERQTLVLAGEIAHCTLNRLNRKGVDGGIVFSYSIYDQYEVINTNALLGAVFCQLGALLDDRALLALGRGMLKFVIAEQNPDGSWNYFSKRSCSSPRIDNYHSAMTLRGVLESLDYLEISQDKAREVVESGLRFYETEFLNERVFPALRPERSYPKDIACIAEGALVYEALLRYGWGDRDRLKDGMCALLAWAIRNMQKRDGRFLYRKYPLFGVDLKSIRWGQGMMLMALASAMAHLDSISSLVWGNSR